MHCSFLTIGYGNQKVRGSMKKKIIMMFESIVSFLISCLDCDLTCLNIMKNLIASMVSWLSKYLSISESVLGQKIE